MNKRIGIFSGVFDPVHIGHVSFALEAAKQARLDEVYFLVEAVPRRKTGVTHLGHRTAMIKLAVEPYPKLKLLDLPDKQFSVAKTLPRLRQRFPDDSLIYLTGSDMLEYMPKWQLIDRLLSQMGLIVGLRGSKDIKQAQNYMKDLPVQPVELRIINGPNPKTSSQQIRDAIMKGNKVSGLPVSEQDYIKTNWLYAAPSSSSSSS